MQSQEPANNQCQVTTSANSNTAHSKLQSRRPGPGVADCRVRARIVQAEAVPCTDAALAVAPCHATMMTGAEIFANVLATVTHPSEARPCRPPASTASVRCHVHDFHPNCAR
jgi:hypothetical protein